MDKDEELLLLKKENYQKRLDAILESFPEGERHSLLLHSCCGPCSSYCMEYLSAWFDVTVYYYNPNITADKEYKKRVEEQQRLIREMNADLGTHIRFMEGNYEPERFLEETKGLGECREGGLRCVKCFRLRLGEAAFYAAAHGFEYFTTTLTISPMKNAAVLNALGVEQGEKYGIPFLPSDFKKKNGYKRSIELSEKYDLYRQNYCGCGYSYNEAKQRLAQCGGEI